MIPDRDIWLADAVEQLSGEFPTLDVRVRAGWGAPLAAQVGAGDLDAAIVMLPAGTQPAAPLIGRMIAAVDVAIVQSRRRPRVRKAVALADLAKQDWILNPIGCGYRAPGWKAPWARATAVCASRSTPTARRSNCA